MLIALVKTLKEIVPRPQVILFVNSGVRLTTEGSSLLPDLQALGELGIRILSCGTCLDYYHLKDRLRVKVPVAENDATVDTVSGVWSTANWHERECWDLMGISFNNHPDLRRILMPADWDGHPLRKDYPVQGPDREPYQGRLQ